jgi:pyridoxamine 5'-phosphate oxidase
MDISELRREYSQRPFSRNSLRPDPFQQFELWLKDAIEAQVIEPNAMILGTANADCKPSTRTVLLKKYEPDGFYFFSNINSRKGKDLTENPFASVTFLWKEIERQVHIEGPVHLVPQKEADEYFHKRPIKSQVSAWASHQDTIISSRQVLEQEFAKYENEFAQKEIPVPIYWTGFCIFPERYEFWQGRRDRLHDRFQYVLKKDSWVIDRLSP